SWSFLTTGGLKPLFGLLIDNHFFRLNGRRWWWLAGRMLRFNLTIRRGRCLRCRRNDLDGHRAVKDRAVEIHHFNGKSRRFTQAALDLTVQRIGLPLEAHFGHIGSVPEKHRALPRRDRRRVGENLRERLCLWRKGRGRRWRRLGRNERAWRWRQRGDGCLKLGLAWHFDLIMQH